MRTVIIIFLIWSGVLVYMQAPASNTYDVNLVSVYDGDTVYLESELWPDSNQFIRLRIYGIDTPEIRTRKLCEKELGKQAKRFLARHLADKVLTLTNVKTGKYAGRVIGDLYADGILVSKVMLDSGYATPYFGKKKTKVWC